MSLKKLIACLWLGCCLGALAAAQTYTVTDVGTLPGDSSSLAYFSNASGQVTGCSDNTTSQADLCQSLAPSEAYLWSSSGIQDLHNLPGNDSSIGYYVNDAGTVVGYSANTQSGIGHAFVWTKSTGMVDLGTLPGGNGYSLADAITSKGIIVGQSFVSNGNVHAVAWTLTNGKYQIQDYGTLPGALYTYPYDINEKLQVAGVAYFDKAGTMYHGFFASPTTGYKDLGTLQGGGNSFADFINSSGIIVGSATSTQFPNGVAVAWDTTRKIHSIGTLPGGDTSFAGGVNDSNQVVGESTISGGASHAFVWTIAGGMKDLNKLIPQNSGWVLNHASAINNNGQIVGYGTINGENHAYILTP